MMLEAPHCYDHLRFHCFVRAGQSPPPGTVAWGTACKQRLADPFPLELIEEKNGLSYLPHEAIRQRLIEATGNCFDWTIDQILFRDDGVTRRAKDRTTGEVPRPLSMVVVGRLAIPELGTRAGIGPIPSMPGPERMPPTECRV